MHLVLAPTPLPEYRAAMAEPLRVLVYGSVDAGVCDFVRLGVYRALLADHGVELRTWGELNDYRVHVPPGYGDRLDDAFRDGVAAIDTSPIDWADVLVFRRWYGTVPACEGCDFVAPDLEVLANHARRTGHEPATPDRIIRPLLSAIEHDDAFVRGRAVVYELDDDLLAAQPWLGFYERCEGAFASIVERHRGDRVVLVVHGGVIEQAMKIVERREPTARLKLLTENCSMTEIEFDGERRRLLRYNDRAPLAAE